MTGCNTFSKSALPTTMSNSLARVMATLNLCMSERFYGVISDKGTYLWRSL